MGMVPADENESPNDQQESVARDFSPRRIPEHLKAVILDIDGTLVNSWKLGFDATNVVLEKHEVPLISESTYHECTCYATPDRLARHTGLVPGQLGFEETGKKLAAEFDKLYVGLVSTTTAGYFVGMSQLLRDIPVSVALGALTNSTVEYARVVLKTNSVGVASGTYERFRSIRAADNVPAPKPAPDGLQTVCQDLELSPCDCVYIGDSPSDAVAAHAAGMPSIGVLWGSHPLESMKKAPFSILCETSEELRLVLGKHGAL